LGQQERSAASAKVDDGAPPLCALDTRYRYQGPMDYSDCHGTDSHDLMVKGEGL
jgi:hypothetical protein